MHTFPQDNIEQEHLNLSAEQEAEKYIQSIITAVENEPWGVILLQLAWTAGPLTFIALQGGYLLGYGKTAPFSLFTYFAGYTLIAGFLGLFIKTIYNAHQEKNNERLKSNYLYSVDVIFQLMHLVSDYRLEQLPKREQKIESSSILLRNTHALPASIELGVQELTNNSKLSLLSKKIELFRRAGLHSRVKSIIENNQEIKQTSVQNLLNTPNDAAYFLKLRLEGQAPSIKDGIEREDGFLQRINQAIEESNPEIMTLKDAEAFLILLFELLNGRKIEFLTFTYTGNKTLRYAAKALEKARAHFRSARAALYAEIDKLYTILVNEGVIEDVKDYDARIKYELIFKGINDHYSELLSYTSFKGREAQIALFTRLLKIHGRLHHQFRKANAYQKELNHAQTHWQKVSNQYSDKKTRFRYGRGKKGLRIAKKTIALNDQTKLICADRLVEQLQSLHELCENTSNLTPVKIKQSIMALSQRLNQFINISNPIHQFGIESSKATNFGSLDMDSSIEVRALWAAAMVRETKSNIRHAAEKLSKVLLYQYNETLDEQAVEFLHQTYYANKTNLYKFIEEKNEFAYKTIQDIPFNIEKTPVHWDKMAKKLKKQKG